MMERRTTFLAILSVASLSTATLTVGEGVEKDALPYGFFPSGEEGYRHFVHNLFGFSIRVPANWTFGVVGEGATAVALLYPKELDTREFSEDYETVEIGRLPLKAEKLEGDQRNVMLGMTLLHPGLELLDPPKQKDVDGVATRGWSYRWKSKTGIWVVEKVTLFGAAGATHSVTVRTCRPDHGERTVLCRAIVESFVAFTPKHEPAKNPSKPPSKGGR